MYPDKTESIVHRVAALTCTVIFGVVAFVPGVYLVRIRCAASGMDMLHPAGGAVLVAIIDHMLISKAANLSLKQRLALMGTAVTLIAGIEICQGLIGRSASMFDFIAGTAGAVAASVIYAFGFAVSLRSQIILVGGAIVLGIAFAGADFVECVRLSYLGN